VVHGVRGIGVGLVFVEFDVNFEVAGGFAMGGEVRIVAAVLHVLIMYRASC